MQVEWAWKGFLLLHRLLLHRKCRGGKIAKDKLKERFDLFQSGRWAQLLGSSVVGHCHTFSWETSSGRGRFSQKLCGCCVTEQTNHGTHCPLNWSITCPVDVFGMEEDRFASNCVRRGKGQRRVHQG